MDPIISPWIVYAISITEKVYLSLNIVMFVAFGFAFLFYFDGASDYDEQKKKKNFTFAKKALAVALICALFVIVAPNKETLLTMLALSYVTPDNIQSVQGNIADFIAQIIRTVAENIK